MGKHRDAWLREIVNRRIPRIHIQRLDAIVRLVRAVYELEDGSGLGDDHLEAIALAAGEEAAAAKEFAKEVRAGLKKDPLYRNSFGRR